MIELKLNAPTAPELASLVKSLAAQFGVNLSTAQAEIVAEVEHTELVAEKAEKPKEEKKAAKTKKTETVKEETAKEETKSATKEDIAAACQKVSETKNLDAAKAILAQFMSDKGEACRRISDVQVSDYGVFIAKCEEAIA
jgi:hypothetical protein